MPSVFEDFAALWRPRPVVEDSGPSDEELQAKAAEVADRRAFIACQAYGEYRKMVEREIRSLSPDPALGIEAAACYTFKREGLQRALDLLDHLVRLAQEKVDDGS